MVMDPTMLVDLLRDGKVLDISSMMPKVLNTNISNPKWKFSQNLQANASTWKIWFEANETFYKAWFILILKHWK